MQDFQDLKDLADLAGLKLAGISMPGRSGGRPLKFYFIKDLDGGLLNNGESMDGGELTRWLKARISDPAEGENSNESHR